jgi:hypothetical protein
MTALKQNVPRTQSPSVAHGNAHLPYARLQRWFRHIASLVHGDAAGPGTVRGPDSVVPSLGGAAALTVAEMGRATGVAAGAGSPGTQPTRTSAASVTRGKGPTGPRTTRATFRMARAVGVPFSGRMRKWKIRSAALARAWIASLGCLAGCTRGEPPQWDAGPGVSLAVVPLVLDAEVASSPSDASADAAPSLPAGGDESGRLPQTRARPEPAGDAFNARVRGLFEAIAEDDVARAMPFFFPLTAYAQVKAIANPAADWKARLVAHYARDIHALHAKLGPNASHARFVAADVPMDRARWVEPGEEYNRIGYYRVYGTKLSGDIDGTEVSLDVTSLISWRGEWFVVHLTGVK